MSTKKKKKDEGAETMTSCNKYIKQVKEVSKTSYTSNIKEN